MSLVRSFSMRVAEETDEDGSDGTLRTLVAEEFRHADREEPRWQKYFEPWTPTTSNNEVQKLFNDQAVELSKQWTRFRDKVPDEAKYRRWAHRAPSLNDVKQVMQDVDQSFHQKRKSGATGFITSHYSRACVFIKEHEGMLKVIPQGSEYVSLISGVLTSIVFATARYEEVSTGLSKLIADISEDVAMCVQVLDVYQTAAIKTQIMALYGRMFKFLASVLDWYLEKWYKRMLKSFKENLYDDFKDQITDMQRCVQSIKDQVMLGQSAELRSVRLTAEKTQQIIMKEVAKDLLSLARNEMVYFREENKRFQEMQERKALTSQEEQFRRNAELKFDVTRFIQATLQEKADNLLLFQEDHRPMSRHGFIMDASPSASLMEDPSEHGGVRRSREDILLSSASLEDFFDRDNVRIPWNPDLATLPAEATDRLQQWIMSRGSNILSLASSDAYSPLSDVAAGVIELIDKAKLPIISYFCTLDREASTQDGETRETRAATSLVYALIRQAFELLPAVFSSSKDFSPERFRSLDGDIETFEAGLGLLHDGLSQAPPALYCVIDGLQWLDDRSTDQMMDSLVRALQDYALQSSGLGIAFKLLLTTAGPARSLLRSSLDRRECYTLEGGSQPLAMW
ncbi:uncharacterized protein RCC_06086 [Ramularia collo-cygni]|uniref:DUF7708 domain-containing protein n=1 Tax=Ramularia collo-cygni TaxID=112498 RepID=A0A2D3VEP5_9PEZI|nr:uncharacterized protein RCC_06086 [Ramularia collo-cygni]CZT20229.1 uncharacterized protein RCC_06086 [Ramularia collo-cygni]